jgi:hypothetical protein
MGKIMHDSIKPKEPLIESLWVLDRSGICIFEENYVDFTKEGISKDLVGSFMAALLTFADETFSDQVQHLKLSNRKILFKFSRYLLFVIAVHDKDTQFESDTKEVIEEIVLRFVEKYEHIFEQDKWNGNIRVFAEFSDDLKEILEIEPLKVKFWEIFDFKDYYRKFEAFMKKKSIYLLKNKEKLENLIDDFKIKKGFIEKIKLTIKRHKIEKHSSD